MFEWDKSISSLGASATQVIHLFKSMRDVQLALPGMPSQMSTAYLCQYKDSKGIATVAAFHLHKSHHVAFYQGSPSRVSPDNTDDMLDQGLVFVESMGFLLSDMDIHLLEGDDKDMLWEALPLQKGAEPPETPAEPSSQEPSATHSSTNKSTTKASNQLVSDAVASLTSDAKPAPKKKVVSAPPAPEVTPPAPSQEPEVVAETAEGVDDLLAAVDAMRAKRPGLRARKKMPTADELQRRRDELRENVGRILASL